MYLMLIHTHYLQEKLKILLSLGQKKKYVCFRLPDLPYFFAPDPKLFFDHSKNFPEIGMFSQTGSLKYEIKMAAPRWLRFPTEVVRLDNCKLLKNT